jgi:hypothetical protein
MTGRNIGIMGRDQNKKRLQYDDLAKSRKSLRIVIPIPVFTGINSSRATEGRRSERSPAPHGVQGEASEHIQYFQINTKTLDTGFHR